METFFKNKLKWIQEKCFKMNPLSSELQFHVHNWLIISLKDFCIVIRKWPTFWPSTFHIPSLSGMLYLQGMICHSSNLKSSLLTCVMAVHSTNHAMTAVIMILKDRNSLHIKIKKIDLKVEMWPVNALRLEWCYDTGNDKNVTIIRLSMQLI